jgi:hypothetical protein
VRTTLLVVVGILAVVLGGAGVIGLLDNSRFRLYRSQQASSSPERHRTAQRVGGGAIVVVGVVFLVMAFRG